MYRIKLSVIIPVFNAESYMGRCVRSLFEQTLDDIEYIFVNDGTTDRSIQQLQQLVTEYPDRAANVKIISHETNKGVAATRNTGLGQATGDYIGWVDSDDWGDAEMFSQFYHEAVKHCSDLVWCDFYNVREGQKQLESLRCREDPVDVIKAILSGTRHGTLCTCIAKRELYTEYEIRFPEGINMMEDKYVLVQLMFFAKRIKYIPRPYYYYEKGNVTSATSAWNNLRVPREAIDSLNATIDFLTHTTLRRTLWQEMKYARLILKRGLLNSLDIASFKMWRDLFPGDNKDIWSCPNMTWRQKLLGWSISHNYWVIARIWISLKKRYH